MLQKAQLYMSSLYAALKLKNTPREKVPMLELLMLTYQDDSSETYCSGKFKIVYNQLYLLLT